MAANHRRDILWGLAAGTTLGLVLGSVLGRTEANAIPGAILGALLGLSYGLRRTRAAKLVLGLAITLLVLILLTPRGFRDTWDRLFVAEMQSALRNLATAEEQYHSQHGTYTAELEVLDTASSYLDRVGLTVSHADSGSWEATATHEFLTTTCTISRNDSSLPLFGEACTKRQYSKAWEAYQARRTQARRASNDSTRRRE